MEREHRVKSRVNYAAHALVKSTSRGIKRGLVRDISSESMYLYMEPLFEIGEKVNVEIILLGENSELSIRVPAKVVRIDKEGVAASFLSPLEWWPLFSIFPLYELEENEG